MRLLFECTFTAAAQSNMFEQEFKQCLMDLYVDMGVSVRGTLQEFCMLYTHGRKGLGVEVQKQWERKWYPSFHFAGGPRREEHEGQIFL